MSELWKKKKNSNKPLRLLSMAYTYMESCFSHMASQVCSCLGIHGAGNWSASPRYIMTVNLQSKKEDSLLPVGSISMYLSFRHDMRHG